MAIMFSLLIPVVLGILPIKELEQSANEAVFKIDNSVYIKPYGPLDLVHGLLSRERRQIHKKRLYSPGLKAHYSLKNKDGKVKFDRMGSKDVSNTFGDDGNPISMYLSEYYKSVKTMYTAANGNTNIFTNREKSLCMFLLKSTSDNNVNFQILAALFLLAEGVDVPLTVKNEICDYVVEGMEKSKSVPVLKYEGGEDSLIKPIRVELSIIIDVKKEKREGEEIVKYTEKELHTLNEIVSMVRFFKNYGGENVGKISSYGLLEDDTPSFLIRSYIFEFLQDLNEARLFIKIVNDMLISTKNVKGSETWNTFFTTDKEEVDKYNPVYKAFKTIGRVIDEFGFPFCVNSLPPAYMTVTAYDREKEEFTNDITFSDCCDIAIYSLFCGLLYDPATSAYSLAKLKNNGYEPTKELEYFFEKFCVKPTGEASLELHQEWTRVIQDLVLTEDELLGNGRSDNNTIQYCTIKEVDGRTIRAEVNSDLLNILKVIAKVIRMPEEKMRELGRICKMVEDDTEDLDSIKFVVGDFTTRIFNEISVMDVEVDVSRIKALHIDAFRRLYGDDIDIRFILPESDKSIEKGHVIRVYLTPYHGEAGIVPRSDEIKKEDREELERLAKECEEIESKIGKPTAERVRDFLSLGAFKPIPQELLEKVEQVKNNVEKYLEISKLLNAYKISTIDDKLYIIDAFSPYLYAKTCNNGSKLTDEAVLEHKDGSLQNPQEASNINTNLTKTNENCNLKSNDPVVQLISNIISSVPLNDEATRYYFVQIFAVCNGKYNVLFPGIKVDADLAPPLRLNNADIEVGSNLSNFLNYNAPNMINRLFNWARRTYKDLFFETMRGNLRLDHWVYYPMVKNCIRSNLTAVLKVIKEDFRIRKGMIEPGSMELVRFTKWFIIGLEAEYYEGLVVACDSWKRIFKKEDRKISLMQQIKRWNPKIERWDALHGAVIKKLYANERYISALIEIFFYFARLGTDLDEIYNLFISQFSINLCHSLMGFFEELLKDTQVFLAEMKIPDRFDNQELKLDWKYRVNSCLIITHDIEYFIKRILNSIESWNILRSDPDIVKEMEAIIDRINGIIIKLPNVRKDANRKRILIINLM